MPLWHLTWSSRGRLRLLPDQAAQRAAVRTLGRLDGDRLLLFSIVDDHVHAVVDADSGARTARSLRMGLQPLTQAPVDPAHVRPVEERSHLSWLVRYLLRQVDKHGLAEHPALWSGSCFQDLVGTRAVLPSLAGRLATHLPRLRQRELFDLVGLDAAPLEPASSDQRRAAGAARRLLSHPAPDAHVLAARRRVALEDRVAALPRPPLQLAEPDVLDWTAAPDG